MGLFSKKRWVKPIFVGSNGGDLTRGIYVFHLDIENGEILKKKFYKSQANPSALYRRERFIYVCYKNKTGRATDGGVWQYASMDLQFGLAAKALYKGHTYVDSYVNEERTYAYAVDYYNSEVVTIPILKQKIVKMSQVIHHDGHGVDAKYQAEAHPCFIDETPDHRYIYVCDLGIDQVVMYDVKEKGKLECHDDATIHLKEGSGPKKMIFTPDGKFAYVLNALSNTVCCYRYENEKFTFIQEISTYPTDEFIHQTMAGDIVMSQSGDYLFASNCGHDSVAAYEINQETGELELVEYIDVDENPGAMIVVDDHWVVVAAQKTGTIESFEIKRGETKGILYETHFNYMVGEPVCLVEGRGF